MASARWMSILTATLLAANAARSAEPVVDLGTITERHVMVPMRDGQRLSTYLYFPAGKGPWPVLYEQRYADLRSAETRKSFARLAAAGYVVAAENFRGTHLSEGTWVGYRALGWGEQRDGYDTVEWLAKQPWSTGKIGTFGSSQAGFAQNFLAVTQPPHLVCQYMIDTGLSLFHEGYRIGGTTRPERFKQMDAVCRNAEDNRRLLQEWFAHPTYDDYWAAEDCTRHIEKMNVPCFTVGSWYDFMCVGSVESFIGRQHRGGVNSRGKQQLLIGPWLHGRFKETNQVGELTYPENAKFALEAHLVRWFDHYLKGIDNGVERDRAVRYYVMGPVGERGAPGNEWRTATDWPLAARATPYYLHGGGKLSTTMPGGDDGATTFAADPLHPNEIPGWGFPGARDARAFEKQAEVRTFTSEVLTEPAEWTGKVQAELYVSSTARDTDFIVRLSDVYPDGRSLLIMDYVRRARYRDGYEKEMPLEPGKVYKVAFDVGWLSQIFGRGHRIRVTVASTGAPFFEPNPNTGEPLTIESPARTVVAKNTVHHNRQHASRIIAPLQDPGITEKQKDALKQGLEDLNRRLEKRQPASGQEATVNADLWADAAVFAKGLGWALRYDSQFTKADVEQMTKAIERCRSRLEAIEAGKQPWTGKQGRFARGYVSSVDGSVQPYGVIVPASYDGRKPMRLDVVLHGSTRPVGMSELRFLSRFDEGDEPARAAPEADYIELHPLGRVENCYRWAGETDVFEAIEAVARNYQIDRDRIVLRGMSMGASGTWHLGLKHPDRFVALGPYCGYVDTHQFSETPLPNFIKVGPLPPHQERGLHMLDSIDYAANAGVVPAIACMGDKDVFFQAHVIMGQAMAREGLKMVNLISPGTGHVIDPATHKEQMRRIQQHAAKGLDRLPRHIRFVTWTLKYSRCHWLQVLGLEEHYARGELEATLADDGAVEVKEPRNITRFAILPPVLERAAPLRVGGQPVELPARQKGAVARGIVIGKRDGKWACLGDVASAKLEGKRPGLQGPIDDAFTTPFLCVRGTGKPWNPPVQAWSEASLQRFASEWQHYFRGELPVKDDSAVTDDDLRRCNLILFGDPGSNRWIGRVLPSLPIRWTQEELEIGQARYAAADHTPLLIHPNPLAAGRYVVLGSGHTFHEHELASLNYLLFPRLGDWAVLKVGDRQTANPSEPLAEAVAAAGFCDERWQPVGIAMMPGGQSPSAAAAEAATDSIRVADRKELPFDTFPCERIALGEPDDYKPCLALLPGGELLMTAFHQHPREGGKVLEQDLLFRSRDGGRTWSAPEKLGLLGREPYLTVLKDGTLFMTGHLLANDVRNPHGYTHGYLHRSTDAGKTWKSVRIESEGIRPKAPNHSSRNVVQMPDGTLLLGVDYDGGGGPYFVWRSKDGGKTWDKSQRCEPLGFKSKYGFFQGEAWLWLAKSGKLLALVRVDSDDIPIQGRPAQARDDQDDHFVLYESSDGAKTFRRVGDLGDYGEMYMSLLRLQDERLLLTFTVRKRNPPLGVRAILGVEHDDGFTLDFAHDRLLLDTKTGSRAQGGGFGPTVQLKDGSLVTCCSYRGADDKTHLEVIRWRLSR